MPAPCPAAAPCRRWPWNRRPGCDALAPTHTHAPTETHSDAHTRWRTPRRRAALSKALTVTARRWEVVVAPGEADRLAPMVQSLSRRYLGPDFSNREVDDDKRPKGELPAAGPRRGWRCVCVGACVSVGGVRGLHVHRGKMAPPSVLPATCLAGSPCHATPRTPPGSRASAMPTTTTTTNCNNTSLFFCCSRRHPQAGPRVLPAVHGNHV